MGNKKHDKHSKHEKHGTTGTTTASRKRRLATTQPSEYYAGTLAPSRPWEGALAITGVRLIDGTGADPIDNATIVVEGERITAVGRVTT